ncbi:Pycsar system effector family protein [Lentzea sp. DG1S-22]|uniref:Pycsar system effector family protein n=1 Tax=Lentzea sp. DG1S-22 TaxID=3108822 RepID=UPI002E77A8EB|nr:Pycsar system effector family protein [Lentzea sp. DG1S-22]WVH84379.1 Pycsar system effector family protein [Lentzea sp. DG1S-22]
MSEHSDKVVARVEQAQTDVADQLRRADQKAASMLPLFGGFLAGVVALARGDVPPVAQAFLWLAAVPMMASVLLLLSAVRPRRVKGVEFGFVRFAGLVERPSELLEQFESEESATALAVDVCRASVIVRAKYTDVRIAIDLLMVGVLLFGVAVAVTAA